MHIAFTQLIPHITVIQIPGTNSNQKVFTYLLCNQIHRRHSFGAKRTVYLGTSFINRYRYRFFSGPPLTYDPSDTMLTVAFETADLTRRAKR